jgi:uncharacterized protein YjbI with pentapeptide repeats
VDLLCIVAASVLAIAVVVLRSWAVLLVGPLVLAALWRPKAPRGSAALLLVVCMGLLLPLALLIDGEHLERFVLHLQGSPDDTTAFMSDLLHESRYLHLRGGLPVTNAQNALRLDGRSLRDANLGGAQLQYANLMGAQLHRAHLDHAQLQGVYLGSAQLQDADLNHASLQGAQLYYALLRGAHLEGAHLKGAHLEGADLEGAHLDGADLEGADLEGADLEGADLAGAHLEGAYLEGADLEGADLEGAHLAGAHLAGADLVKAQLQDADLEGAQLQGADLEGAQLQGADLREVQLQGASLRSAEIYATTTFEGASGELIDAAKIAGEPLSTWDERDLESQFVHKVDAYLAGLACESPDIAGGILLQVEHKRNRDLLDPTRVNLGTLLRTDLENTTCKGVQGLSSQKKDQLLKLPR